ncbi:MAG: hypothetical protein FJX33_13765 [Alphaproteobacteria bacterium]|nr:hypothetical protein [Alphaproteobacteria bacterium]
MPRLAPLLALPILPSCASATQTYAPDGRSALAVDCGGLWRDWGACMERAGESCGSKGYDILARDTDRNRSGSYIRPGSAGGGNYVTTLTRNMLIACRGTQQAQDS